MPRAATVAKWALLAALVGVLGANSLHYHPFVSDDALISLRYGRRLAAGLGLTWTDGERVEGYTNLLWVLLAGRRREAWSESAGVFISGDADGEPVFNPLERLETPELADLLLVVRVLARASSKASTSSSCSTTASASASRRSLGSRPPP